MTEPPTITRELPPLGELTEQQIRGQRCVWCSVPLDNGTARDLGPRYVIRAGSRVRWFPRSCPAHTGATS